MASVTVTVPSGAFRTAISGQSSQQGWVTRLNLGKSLSDSGLDLFFTQLSFGLNNSVRLFLDAAGSNDDFTDQMLNHGDITIVDSAGRSIVITSIFRDVGDTEPYVWIPDNGAAFRSFVLAVRSLSDRSVTITFNDNAGQIYIKHNNVWVPSELYQKSGGSWSQVDLYSKVSGEWKQAAV